MYCTLKRTSSCFYCSRELPMLFYITSITVTQFTVRENSNKILKLVQNVNSVNILRTLTKLEPAI